MATTGFKFPTTDTAVSGSWTNATNVQADDGAYATVAPGKNTTAARDAGGFGLNIPLGSTITQVNVKVEWKVSTTASIATLRCNGNVSGSILANHDNAAEPTTDTVQTFDITADRAWAVADFADGTFFVRFQAVQGSSSTAVTFSYDYIQVEVVYTPPRGGHGTLEGEAHPLATVQFLKPALRYPKRAIDMMRYLGLTTNLQLCLDSADANSFTSGDKWLDLSGNGFDFYRGSSSSGDAAEPTFNGSAGGLSAADYFSYDGADYFEYDTTNETWMQNIHKDHAAFTLVFAVYKISAGAGQPFAATAGRNVTTDIGFSFGPTAGEALIFQINTGSAVQNFQTSATIPGSQWDFCAVSLNEDTGSNGCVMQINATQELKTSSYSAPSASNASRTMQFGFDGGQRLANLTRMGVVLGWSRALSAAELNAAYAALKTRYTF